MAPKSAFINQLKLLETDPAARKWLYVPYDQVSDAIGPLSREDPKTLGIILVENPWKPSRRPYHKQKLMLILSNLRHFALEQAKRGVAVKHIVTNGPYRTALEPFIKVLKEPITVMEPSERELREDLAPLIKNKLLLVIPHEGWLANRNDLLRSAPKGPPWRMDAFYRVVRQRTGLLMAAGKPIGGKYSFDQDNRRPWRGVPKAPSYPTFSPDAIDDEVTYVIEKHFARHPGVLDPSAVPTTREDAEQLWQWVKTECLENFGPFEDAMSVNSPFLFHTRISALLNICRLNPVHLLNEVESMDISFSSKEGFVRQILGWREFMHLVHRETDGFRLIDGQSQPIAEKPGDGGYANWQGASWLTRADENDPDGGAKPSFLGSQEPVPPAYWGAESGMKCLDTVVNEVWQNAYSHHITRLMVLSNIATMLDLSPRDLTDWFWVAYIDAFDWVVEPNVLGMSTFGLGELFTTKPYIAGSAYIDKMSDYCRHCQFDPKTNCPLTSLYWAFLARHEAKLKDNQRVAMPLNSMRKRDAHKKVRDAKIFQYVSQQLRQGKPLEVEDVARLFVAD